MGSVLINPSNQLHERLIREQLNVHQDQIRSIFVGRFDSRFPILIRSPSSPRRSLVLKRAYGESKNRHRDPHTQTKPINHG
jgi:hypothetical protein